MPPLPAFHSSTRGSALLTSLILTATIGVVLVSQLQLSRTTIQLSDRSFYSYAAFGLAETGIEQGVWALNAANHDNPQAWNGWTTSGNNASRSFDNFPLGGSLSGKVHVTVLNYKSGTATIVARSEIPSVSGGGNVEKWLKVEAANIPTTSTIDRSRSIFAYGLLARDKIQLSGGTWMDSWQSNPNNDPNAAFIPWSASVARENARVATQSSADGAISISGSGAIYGSVSLGSTDNSALQISAWSGWVGPRDGTPISPQYRVVSEAMSYEFTASFETVKVPENPIVQAPYTLPRNVSGPPYYLNAESIGETGHTTTLQMNAFSVSGDATVTIKGNVVLVLPASGSTVMNVGGSGKIVLEDGATLAIYTPGNISVSGAGITNTGSPSNVQIWGTSEGNQGTQNISLSGSGAINAVVYAPNAKLTLPGNTDFSGAAVVYSANLSGSGKFHYDESLQFFTGNSTDESDGGLVGGVTAAVTLNTFEELNTPAERAPYLAQSGL